MSIFPTHNIDSVVRLRTGTAPQIVVDTKYNHGLWYLRARYTRLFDGIEKTTSTWRPMSDYLEYVGDPEDHDYDRKINVPSKKKAPSLVSKLFQTTSETPVRYGTYLVKNSIGEIVLEMKETNKVESFKPDQVEEVKPYTVYGLMADQTPRYFECNKGAVVEGDIVLLDNGSVVTIKKINTGYEGKLETLKGRKLVTEPLGA